MSKGKILIVEDDEDLVHLLAYNLTKKGYHTLKALDGLVALKLIEKEKPDLVLLDIMLPGIDGWQICEIVRHHDQEEISDIPIIMLTALGSSEDKLRGIEMGADDYISKPFSTKEVLLKVERLIQRERKKRYLESMEAQRTDFQDMLFHELRNQLFIIGGYSKRIADNRFLSPGESRYCAGIIRDCSQSLNSLAEELIHFSRLEAGGYPLPPEEISLRDILQRVISHMSTQAEKKRLRIHLLGTEEIPCIRQNPTAVGLVLSNLIENAIKYSPEQSDITVRIGSARGTMVTVDVEDRGPGIPANEKDRIFERFYRGENVKGHTKGTGLGLYISKTLMESMGGTIDVLTSDPEEGTCFRVVFCPAPASSKKVDAVTHTPRAIP